MLVDLDDFSKTDSNVLTLRNPSELYTLLVDTNEELKSLCETRNLIVCIRNKYGFRIPSDITKWKNTRISKRRKELKRTVFTTKEPPQPLVSNFMLLTEMVLIEREYGTKFVFVEKEKK